MALSVSPLAPKAYPALPPIPGVRLSAGECNIRYKNRNDVLLAELAPGTTIAGVYTRSLTAAANIHVCKAASAQGKARALVVSSGNSNAFTGAAGEASVARVTQATAAQFSCAPSEVFMACTGVIGEPLPDERITKNIPALAAALDATAWDAAARAIMTTDTFPKMATRSCAIGGVKVTLSGIAKGSGMIAPDMATMLAFVFTDAAIPAPALQEMLSAANEKSFNRVSVDGDTSTSDMALIFATGAAKNPPGDYAEFAHALDSLMIELAQLVVRDGEGARKFIAITVTGAEHDAAAKRIALSIANSPLVKTAIAGEDANWGRIVMAVGKAGERAERDKLAIDIGGVRVAEKGAVAAGYDEAKLMPHMRGPEINIKVDVGVGNGSAEVWTCDLTHGYIDINGSYRS